MKINPFVIFLVIIALFFAFNAFNPGGSGGRQISYSQFLSLVEAGKVESVSITENRLDLKTKQIERILIGDRSVELSTFSTLLPSVEARDPDLMPTLKKNNVAIQAQKHT